MPWPCTPSTLAATVAAMHRTAPAAAAMEKERQGTTVVDVTRQALIKNSVATKKRKARRSEEDLPPGCLLD